MKIHLVDGTYELFRAFYGAPAALSPTGQEVGATRALLRSLHALTRAGATHLAVAFDTVIASFRNALFAGYKTGEGIEPALHAQFPLAEQAAAALGLVVWPMRHFEADDAICSAVQRWHHDHAVQQIVICSPDKDFGQCVQGDRVVLWDRLRKRVLNEAAIVEKFGVSPASIADWLALVGDTADGIPGIPRWGAKSTATVLAHYHHLDAIADDAAHWPVKVRGATALAQSLRTHRPEAALYRTLATLRHDVPLQESLQDLAWRGAHRAALTQLCQTLGDERFLNQIQHWQL